MDAGFHVYPAFVMRGVIWSGRRLRRAPARAALLALVPAAGLLALAGSATPGACRRAGPSCSAGTCTVSFTAPGTGGSFTVPAGVSALSVTLYGGAGGGTSFGGLTAAGGDGAQVTATLAVSPGETLGVDVGGAGATGDGQSGLVTAGGANGGGNGFDSGGGGGATDVTAGGSSLLVAGGGGGAGTAQAAHAGICTGGPIVAAGGPGGNADAAGTAGESVSGTPNGSPENMEGGFGGAPGTTAGPGAGGQFGYPETTGGFGICEGDGIGAGSTGGSGSGTAGGNGIVNSGFFPDSGIGDAGGGGGGGGYFGGGAGGSGASELSVATTTAGSGGGGGGASYTAGAGVSGALVTDAGNAGQVNGGNGEAVFSYADPVAAGSPAADVAVALSCPSSLSTSKTGLCTLTVTNHGPAAAAKLTAVVTLPAVVSEVSCGGCALHGNVLTWTAPSLASGASVGYQFTVKAGSRPGSGLALGAAAAHNPDPHLLNNVALAIITVKR